MEVLTAYIESVEKLEELVLNCATRKKYVKTHWIFTCDWKIVYADFDYIKIELNHAVPKYEWFYIEDLKETT